MARKGTVVLVRIANNHGVAIEHDARVRITGGGIIVDETFPMQIAAGEVKKHYFFRRPSDHVSRGPTSYPSR